MIRFLRTPERPHWGVVYGAVRPQAVCCLETGSEWDLLRGEIEGELFLHLHERGETVSVRLAQEEELLEFLRPGERRAVARLGGEWVVHPAFH